MPNSLSKDLRNKLARVTLDARTRAEQAARAALENLAVHEKDYRAHMAPTQRQLRNRLRAKGRALGDARNESAGTQRIDHLAEDVAYEQWHRLLFTRFLTENQLLHTDEGNWSVPVTLEDCEGLAKELGAKDGFDLACRFASRTLPGVFRQDDPVLELEMAPNDAVELRRLVHSLPPELFRADDSLGWTYQFWQAKRKDEVNASGQKIGADELPAVTQLFTEDYMVEFLLHNTIGAWWAGKLGPIAATTEEEARAKAALKPKGGLPGIEWSYLRLFQDDATKKWVPAAGTYESWPRSAREIRFLDPCMGSGHFPVFALPLLARLRMEEEGLSAAVSITATLEDNVHGLEIDPRCTQIGAFNLALTAWKLGGWQQLPQLHVACSGLAPLATTEEWLKLVGSNERLREGMSKLYQLFAQAPILGSLIDPRAIKGDLLEAAYAELQPLLVKALKRAANEPAAHEMSITASGVAKAAALLAGQFTIIATNVPYLGRGKQDDVLKTFCAQVYPSAKADLSTCFVERSLALCAPGGTIALVTPQNWLFLGAYKHLRTSLLTNADWRTVARLGTRAFESIGGEVVNVALVSLSHSRPASHSKFLALDAGSESSPQVKAAVLVSQATVLVSQADQLSNPDSTLTFEDIKGRERLGVYTNCNQGIGTADANRYIVKFWELERIDESTWSAYQMAPQGNTDVSGCHALLRWERGTGVLAHSPQARVCGEPAWGKRGVAIAVTSELYRSHYSGGLFDCTLAALTSQTDDVAAAVTAFVLSDEFPAAVRTIDQALSVTESAFLKVPFDAKHWQKVAAQKYPHGLPKLSSSDPTQWLFKGHPAGADQPLHVAVARLLGYQWPRQAGSSFPECPALGPDGLEKLADDDGIVCLPPIQREQPAAARLRTLLSSALGKFDEMALIGVTDSEETSLEDWLRNDFFEQHCSLFHHRPFIWHVWDGRKDGFSALVNYHRLDHDTLKKLTYSYLGDWLRQQEQDAKADKPGAAERLGAAQALQDELAKILEGEAPYDLFVRWKPLHRQAIGWHPDVNDGVRLNIRPFMQAQDMKKKGAGLLRTKPNIKWDKDRGTEPERDKADFPWFWSAEEPPTDFVGGRAFTGLRWNDVHYALDAKREARKRSRR